MKKVQNFDMKAASNEIRTKVIEAYLAEKATPRKLADIFGYTYATICNWIRSYKTENRLSPKPRGHRKSCFSDEEKAQLQELLEKNVDMTLEEIRQHFSKNCSLTAIHKIVVKLGFVFKKNSKGERTRSRRYKNSS